MRCCPPSLSTKGVRRRPSSCFAARTYHPIVLTIPTFSKDAFLRPTCTAVMVPPAVYPKVSLQSVYFYLFCGLQFFFTETERGLHSPTSWSVSSTSPMRREDSGHEGDEPPTASIATLPDPSPIVSYWSAKRHLTCGNPVPTPPWTAKTPAWRAAPGKLKTSYAALVLCLNIDVDPPDIVKTNPCVVLES